MSAPATPGATAGQLLRRARQAKGLEIAALAAAMKVAPRKLELLEADRFDELNDTTFARALAQSMCRSLGLDPAPVLALLPQAPSLRMDHLGQGLNTPFRERADGLAAADWSVLTRTVVWAPALIVLAAAVLYFYPTDRFVPVTSVRPAVAVAPAASAVSAAADPASAASTAVVETVYSVPPPPDNPASAVPSMAGVSGLLQLRTTAQSWVEVLDARGQMLLSRVIQPGETVGLDGPLPMRVKIGNSAGTQLTFRGELVELTPFSRENVAKLELK